MPDHEDVQRRDLLPRKRGKGRKRLDMFPSIHPGTKMLDSMMQKSEHRIVWQWHTRLWIETDACGLNVDLELVHSSHEKNVGLNIMGGNGG